MTKNVVVVDGLRTPFVRAGAELRDVPALELGRAATRELLARTSVSPEDVDEVVFGCVAQPAESTNIARVIALRAGLPRSVPATTVGRNCASGMEALTYAAERIAHGASEVVVCGGVESMSRVPLQYPLSFSWKLARLLRARGLGGKIAAGAAVRLRDLKPVIALEQGLTDPITGEIMGLSAERIARDFAITRSEQDDYALESHRRASRSREFLAGEIAPFGIPPRFYELLEEDVGPRENQSLEALGRLRPYFDRRFGTVTVGNSCQVTDGAVALLLMEEERARSEGYSSLGRIVSHAYRGCEPERMGLGPVYSTRPALRAAGLALSDLVRVELNEAFAAQVLACQRAFGSRRFAEQAGWSQPVGELDLDLVNVHGGAIALGHPVGATGSRLVLTLLRQLNEAGGGFGLATLCIGGGQGGSVVVEGRAA